MRKATIILAIGLLAAVLVRVDASPPASPSDALCARVVSCLEGTLRDLEIVARTFGSATSSEPDARRILRETVEAYQNSTSLMLVDTSSVFVAAYPPSAQYVEGQKIPDEGAWERLQTSGESVVYEFLPGSLPMPHGALLVAVPERGPGRGGALQLTFGLGELFEAVCRELQLDEGGYEVFLPDGRLVYVAQDVKTSGQGLSALTSTGRRSIKMIVHRMRHLTSGAGSYLVLDKENMALVRRTVTWRHGEYKGLKWIVACGTEEACEGEARLPLAGRWSGAYTEKGHGGEEENEPVWGVRRPGQLNVVVLQDDKHLELWNGRHMAQGAFVGGEFMAAEVVNGEEGRGHVWFWKGEYDAQLDVLRGTIYGDAREAVLERTFFLKRAGKKARGAP